MKYRKLNKEETQKWCEIYWSLIDKGLTHIEAWEIATGLVGT